MPINTIVEFLFLLPYPWKKRVSTKLKPGVTTSYYRTYILHNSSVNLCEYISEIKLSKTTKKSSALRTLSILWCRDEGLIHCSKIVAWQWCWAAADVAEWWWCCVEVLMTRMKKKKTSVLKQRHNARRSDASRIMPENGIVTFNNSFNCFADFDNIQLGLYVRISTWA